MSYLKVAYQLGAEKACEEFKKVAVSGDELLTGLGALVGGPWLGAPAVAALTAPSGERLRHALYAGGGGIGGVLGGATLASVLSRGKAPGMAGYLSALGGGALGAGVGKHIANETDPLYTKILR